MAKRSFSNMKLSMPAVVGIGIVAIAVAAFGVIHSKKAKRAQVAYDQTLPQSVILKPVSNPSTDIAYTLQNATAHPADEQNNTSFAGARQSRGVMAASHGEFPLQHGGYMSNTPIAVPPGIPSPPLRKVTLASGGCQGKFYNGGVTLGYRP